MIKENEMSFHENPDVNFVWLRVFIIVLAFAFLFWILLSSGCKALEGKVAAALVDKTATDHEVDLESNKDVTGDGNQLSEVNDNSQEILSIVTKMSTQLQQQIQNGQGVSAEQIDSMVTDINEISNSSFLMYAIVLTLSLLLAMVIIILALIIKYLLRAKVQRIAMQHQVERAIDNPDNTLDRDKWEALKPIE